MPRANPLHQPSLRIALEEWQEDRVYEFGMMPLRCRVRLYLERPGRAAAAIDFVPDSGASCSFMDLHLAIRLGLPVPPPEAEIDLTLQTARGVTPVRVRPGRIRGWWNAGRDGYPFDWPVMFRTDGGAGTPSILGLGGVLMTCRWTFDGTYAPDFPFGSLALDDLR